MCVYLHSNFCCELKRRIFSATECVFAVQGHPRSTILVPRESFSPSWEVLTLVLSCTVSEILQFFCSWPHPYSILIFGAFPLDQIAHVGVNVSRYLKIISREVIFEVLLYSNLCDHRTRYLIDTHIDRRTTIAYWRYKMWQNNHK